MNQASDLIALLALAAVIGVWLKSIRVRERAVDEARRQCAEHDLQLLDETVGLRAVRLRRVGGKRRLELGYAFEVSAHGDDRRDGRLWMRGGRLVGLSLPSIAEPTMAAVEPVRPARSIEPRPQAADDAQPVVRHDNVIPLRPRRPRTGQ